MAFNSQHLGSLMDPYGKIVGAGGAPAIKDGTMRKNPQTGETEQWIEQADGSRAWNRRNLDASNGETMASPGGGSVVQRLGDVMAPAANSEPPVMRGTPEFEQRVERNRQFLGSPVISAGLMQMGMSLMSGGDLGSSLASGFEGMGNYGLAQQEAADAQRKADIEGRKINLDEDKQTLEEKKFLLEVKKAGGREYTRMVDADSPIGREMGLAKGERALVKFVEDRDGHIVKADMAGNPTEGSGGKGTTVTKLLDEAAAAAAAGDMDRAALLRTAAEKEATGRTTGVTLKEGQQLVTGADGKTRAEWIEGTEGWDKQQADQKAAGGKRIQEIQTGINVRRSVNRSLDTIMNSSFPPDASLTGIGSLIAYIPGTAALEFSADIDTIKSNLGFMKLQDIRDAATKTGGGLGPVSDFENRLLQATVTNLDTKQRAGRMVDNLLYIKAIFTDTEYTGYLTEIGNQVEAGTMNEAEGVKLAGAYLDSKVDEMRATYTAAGKDKDSNPPQTLAPEGAGDAYYHVTPDKQQRIKQLLEKKKEK